MSLAALLHSTRISWVSRLPQSRMRSLNSDQQFAAVATASTDEATRAPATTPSTTLAGEHGESPIKGRTSTALKCTMLEHGVGAGARVYWWIAATQYTHDEVCQIRVECHISVFIHEHV